MISAIQWESAPEEHLLSLYLNSAESAQTMVVKGPRRVYAKEGIEGQRKTTKKLKGPQARLGRWNR
jgi:hypothetical protein